MTEQEAYQWASYFLLKGDTPKAGRRKLWYGEQGRHDPTPADPHPTLNGITQEAYTAAGFAGSVMDMTPAEQDDIYRDYWKRCWANELALKGLCKFALAHYATAFNMGNHAASELLQRAAGMRNQDLDGIMGPRTLKAAAAVAERELLVKYTGNLVTRYQKIAEQHPEKAPNLKGWLLRVEAIQRETGIA